MTKRDLLPLGMADGLLERLPAKIRCENWWWSSRVQTHLEVALGCKWGMSITVPWQPRKFLLLIVQKGPGGWYFSWATNRDFARCPLPEISAHELLGTRKPAPPPEATLRKPKELPVAGKYWAMRFGSWYRVMVDRLACPAGGTGGMRYAPLDRRGYPFQGGVALADCELFWGPVKAWGEEPPRLSRPKLIAAGIHERRLPKRQRAGQQKRPANPPGRTSKAR